VLADQSVTGGLAQLHNTLWWDFTTGSGNGVIENTATNLGRNTIATNYWTDTSLTNEITNPMLTTISRTNVGPFLDPRPRSGSPALSNYASTPHDGFLTPVTYRGAFGSGRNQWISDWTALGEYGIVGGAGGINPVRISASPVVLPPTAPILSIVNNNGATVDITFATEVGHTYQLKASAVVEGPYTDAGSPVPGTGGIVTVYQPVSGEQFFQVLAH